MWPKDFFFISLKFLSSISGFLVSHLCWIPWFNHSRLWKQLQQQDQELILWSRLAVVLPKGLFFLLNFEFILLCQKRGGGRCWFPNNSLKWGPVCSALGMGHASRRWQHSFAVISCSCSAEREKQIFSVSSYLVLVAEILSGRSLNFERLQPWSLLTASELELFSIWITWLCYKILMACVYNITRS